MDTPITAKAAMLQVLLDGPGSGMELCHRITQKTNNGVNFHNGSVYSCLAHMVRDELAVNQEETSSDNRVRMVYSITKKGQEMAVKQRGMLLGLFTASSP